MRATVRLPCGRREHEAEPVADPTLQNGETWNTLRASQGAVGRASSQIK